MNNSSALEFVGKNSNRYSVETIKSDHLIFYLNAIAAFRIKYFREFPYLYEGNLEYEQKYISGFAKNPKALLLIIKSDDEIVGVSTAIPLISDADILGNASKKFTEKKLNPKEFYYYGEVVIKPEHRGQGIASYLMRKQETFAKDLGYKKISLATVVRDKNDPRTPKDYVSTDEVWKAVGFKKEEIFINYEWPTILSNNTIKSIDNQMVFWTKELK
ncbi:MAG: GNAT family N-acetyltransferase [Bdellovibrionota bacterium]